MEFDLKKTQEKQKEILMELDRVCNLCKINYYLSAGTCLGAVRHKGFIPWDDDVDVFMHWEDVDFLIKHKDLFNENYFIQSPETDPDVNTTHVRLRDSNTTCIMKDEVGRKMNLGLFIDIYVLYPYPDSRLKAQKLIIDSFVHRIIQYGDGPKNHGRIANIVGKVINKMYSGKRREKKCKRVYDEYKNNGGKKYYSIYFGEDISLFWSRKYPQKWFEEPSYIEFEGELFPCPTNPYEYCKFRYGNMFMKMPPKEKRVTNHDYIILDLSRSYKKYVD